MIQLEKPTGRSLLMVHLSTDQGNNILKFIAGGNEGKSNYFNKAPDLSKATSLAIDSSVYLLFSDGTIKKYTKGEEEKFTITGLATPLTKPTQIITDGEMTNIYILDQGTGRIIQLSKTGAVKKEYTAKILQESKVIVVLENEKKIQFLAQDKYWEISL
jgi:hypothetical protein